MFFGAAISMVKTVFQCDSNNCYCRVMSITKLATPSNDRSNPRITNTLASIGNKHRGTSDLVCKKTCQKHAQLFNPRPRRIQIMCCCEIKSAKTLAACLAFAASQGPSGRLSSSARWTLRMRVMKLWLASGLDLSTLGKRSYTCLSRRPSAGLPSNQLKLMIMVVVLLAQERPKGSPAEEVTESADFPSSQPRDVQLRRGAGNTDWCACEQCKEMEREIDCLCCCHANSHQNKMACQTMYIFKLQKNSTTLHM